MKRLIVLAVMMVMVTIMAFGGEQALAKAPIVVDDDGVECPEATYSSIQDAVNDAAPGDKIKVCAGVYYESVVIQPVHSGIELKAESGAIIDGSQGPAIFDIDAGIRLMTGVTDVTIKYFEIRNFINAFYGAGINAWNCGTSNIEVVGNYVHDNRWAGILAGNYRGVLHYDWKVKDNRVENNGAYGIGLLNVENGEIKNNVVTGPGGGTGVLYTVGILVEAYNFDQGRICKDLQPDVVINSGNVISDNLVTDYEKGPWGGWGILVAAPSGPGLNAALTGTRVSNNEVSDNGGYGIMISRPGVTHSRISDNNVHNNGAGGIWLFLGTRDNKVTDNISTGNSVLDLFHDTSSTPNFWDDNTCGTKSGADIPDC